MVWPGSKDDPGWINLHCHMKNPDPTKNGGKAWVVGWPFKTINDFISRAAWVETTDAFYDVWYCTSQQRDTTVNRAGKVKAVRLHRNATALKAIWIDCDVKADDPSKHYATMKDAWAAISAFRKKVGLPEPSALVNSGGGLHVYWISTAPLDPSAWRPYAEGLKQLLLAEGVLCDTGLTTDDVRILRVPGTTNHKYDPPRKVEVLHLGRDYNFSVDLSFLKDVPKSNVPSATYDGLDRDNITSHVDVIDPGFTATAPAVAFAALSGGEALAAGITPFGPTLVDPTPIFKECGFLRHALAVGGADYDNPLWNLSVLCTAFMENGNVFAHEISKLHASYTAADTQALYDRKVADRHDRGIGYPSCATIAGSGCKSCATCPHFPKGKSPLNMRPPAAPVTATVKPPAPQSQGARALQLPDGYELNSKNIICLIEDKTDAKSGNVEEIWRPLFMAPLFNPWVQKEPDIIHFQTTYDRGNTIWTCVKHEDWCGQGYEKKLAAAKVKYDPDNKTRLEKFFMAWLTKMHDAAVAQTAQAFGWYHEAGVLRGFAYGGFIHKDDGTSAQAGLTDRNTQSRFQPHGQLKPWYDACQFILMQKRPELDAVIAASFAAPLMQLTGITGAMLSAWGDSGVGKTYALEVGAAVWGHPKKSKEVTSTTWKSMEKRLGSTVNLPAFWDEITNEAAQKNVLEVMMLTTGGVRGGRLNQNTDQRDKETWATLLSINSNLCFKEFVARQQQSHTAGINRVLEYQIVRPANPVGMVSPSTASQALLELSHNYGNVGLEYAKLLGQQHATIQQRLNDMLHDLEKTLQPNEEDRFWIGTIAALVVGAELANKLHVGFDISLLEQFLLDIFHVNRDGRIDATVNPNTQDYAEDHLTAFLKEHLMSTIWVEGTPTSAGKSPHVPWHKLNANAPLPKGVSVRFDASDQTLRFSRHEFREWCKRQNPPLSPLAIVQSLEKVYGLTKDRKTLSAGTGLGGGQEHVYTISVVGHQDLLDILNSHSVSNNDLGASVGISAAAIDTGIATPNGEAYDAAGRTGTHG